MWGKSWRAVACAGVVALNLCAGTALASTSAPAPMQTAGTLGAGQFSWRDADAPAGPVRVLISIPLQRLFVYRGTHLIAVAAVSTGSAGHETPTGEFTVLQKAVKHRSNKYNDAPMPYMQRLTWDGVAIHAGRDPGYAASHGCVRVPLAFARKLYAATSLGAHVSVSDDASMPGLPDLTPPAPVEKAVPAPEPTDPETKATLLANQAPPQSAP